MGLVDAFGKEDRVEMTFSTFHAILKSAVSAELMKNGIDCDVSHQYMREMVTGKKEEGSSSAQNPTNILLCNVDKKNGAAKEPSKQKGN